MASVPDPFVVVLVVTAAGTLASGDQARRTVEKRLRDRPDSGVGRGNHELAIRLGGDPDLDGVLSAGPQEIALFAVHLNVDTR